MLIGHVLSLLFVSIGAKHADFSMIGRFVNLLMTDGMLERGQDG